MSKFWYWFGALTLFELAIALSIPSEILSSSRLASTYVQLLSEAFPAIANFHDAGPNSGLVQFYMALTIPLLPFKIGFCYLWLAQDKNFMQTLVISPLSDKRTRLSDYILEDSRKDASNEKVELKGRSMTSRIIWSVLILLFCILSIWGVLIRFGIEVARGKAATLITERARLEMILQGGIPMWISWSLLTLVLAIMLAVAVRIVRDYFIFFFTPSNDQGRHQ